MGRRNIIAGLVLLAAAGGYGAAALQLPERNIEGTPGPAFFPLLTAAIIIVLSVALVWQGVAQLRVGLPPAEQVEADRKPAVLLVAFALYVFALPYLGFLVASVPFAGALTHLFGSRSRLLTGAIAVGVPVILYLLFREVFGIYLPPGSYARFGL